MESITLHRTALPVLTFVGRQLAAVAGEDTDGSTQGRTHSIAVYEAEDGEFIVSVQYTSPFDSELSDSFVEAVESIGEVEATLSLYDPTERVDTALFDGMDVNKKQSVVTALTVRFDKEVLAVLEKLNALQVS